MKYRKLNPSDIEEFIQLRIKQIVEEGSKVNIDVIKNSKLYIESGIKNGEFLSWVALDKNKIIATSALSIVSVVPFGSNKNGKIGILSCMYCEPKYRRMGIASELLKKITVEARENACYSIQVTGSNVGVLLYDDFGFNGNKNFRQLVL